MSGTSEPYRYQYETVAASVGGNGQVLGTAGAKGDYLHRLIFSNVAATVGTVSILDGATEIVILTAGATVPIGVYSIEMNMASASGAWAVKTGANVTVIAVGRFSV